jgi:hypothetical protein
MDGSCRISKIRPTKMDRWNERPRAQKLFALERAVRESIENTRHANWGKAILFVLDEGAWP